MKTIRSYIYLMLFSIGLIASSPALAADTAVSGAEFMPSYLLDMNNAMDEEKEILSMVFGSVIFDREGGEQSPIGTIAYFTALGSMFLSVIIISYVFFAGALNTAAQGEPLGKNWSTVWLPIRIASGFGLLMPAYGGFAVIQILVIQLLIGSSTAATSLWKYYSASQIEYSTALGVKPPAPNIDQALDLAGSAFCSANNHRIINRNESEGTTSLYKVSFFTGTGLDRQVIDYKNTSSSEAYSIPNGAIIEQIAFGQEGRCGSISLASKGDIKNDGARLTMAGYSSKIMEYLNLFAGVEKQAYDSKINTINYATMGDGSFSSEEEVKNFRDKVEVFKTNMTDFMSTYQDEMYYTLDNAYKEYGEREDTKKEILKSESWMFAASSANSLSRFAAEPHKMSEILGNGIVNKKWLACLPGSLECSAIEQTGFRLKFWKDKMDDMGQESTMVMMRVASDALVDAKPSQHALPGFVDSCAKYDVSCKVRAIKDSTGETIKAFMISTLDNTASLGNDTFGHDVPAAPSLMDFSGNASPFFMASNIGHGLNTIWVVITGASLAVTLLAHALGDSVLGMVGAGGAPAAVDYLLSVISPAMWSIAMSGFIAAYLIPFLLVMRWFWVVANWLLLAIEAVFAAPLAVMLMMTPEGEGLSGANAKIAIMLLVQAVLTAPLNVMGLVAALQISKIWFALLNRVFFGSAAYESAGLFGVVFILVIYITMLTALCWETAGIPMRIVSSITAWFGGGQARTLGGDADGRADQAMNKVDGALQTTAGAAVSGARGSSGSSGGGENPNRKE